MYFIERSCATGCRCCQIRGHIVISVRVYCEGTWFECRLQTVVCSVAQENLVYLLRFGHYRLLPRIVQFICDGRFSHSAVYQLSNCDIT
jgi:hypothetical protein